MKLNQRGLVLLSYPFTDQKGSKIRPAIIVSNEDFNNKCQDCVMIPLTTIIKDEPYSLIINQENLESGKLLKQSRVRIDKVFTIDKSLIIIQIGKINDKTFSDIKEEILKIF